MELAPGLFSMKTPCPSRLPRQLAIRREKPSTPEPALVTDTMRTGRTGESWAMACVCPSARRTPGAAEAVARAKARATKGRRARRRTMEWLMLSPLRCRSAQALPCPRDAGLLRPRGNAVKAKRRAAQPLLPGPVRDQPPDIGGREHAVRKHVVEAGAAGEVDVDVDRVVVARGAGIQRQRGAGDRGQLERGDAVAHLHVLQCRGGHVFMPSRVGVAPGLRADRRCARRPGC